MLDDEVNVSDVVCVGGRGAGFSLFIGIVFNMEDARFGFSLFPLPCSDVYERCLVCLIVSCAVWKT